jgi:hypothetical protein
VEFITVDLWHIYCHLNNDSSLRKPPHSGAVVRWGSCASFRSVVFIKKIIHNQFHLIQGVVMHRYILLPVVLLVLLACVLQAQKQPVMFNPNMLAHSQGLPNDFLLFSPDTSVQILFNPARAALTDRRFVYANYLPYNGQTFSAASLFNALGATWLLQVSNTLYKYSDDYTSNSQNLNIYTYSSEIEKYLNGGTSTGFSQYNNSRTSVKLSFIGGTSEDSYSLGVYGILYPNERTYQSYSSQVRLSATIPGSMHYSDVYNSTSRQHDENSISAAGAEYSLSGSKWDLITGIEVRKNKLQSLSTYNYTDEYLYYDNSGSSNYSDRESYSGDGSSSVNTTEPIIYKAYGYFHHNADIITSTDHYFISSNIYSSSGKIFMNYNETQRRVYQYDNNPPSAQTTSRTIFHQEETNDWGVKITSGYLVVRNLDDIEIMAGVHPQFGYDEYKIAPSNSWIVNEHVWSAVLQLPIYLNFTPATWCSFFGGLNYRYTYTYAKEDISSPLRQYSENNYFWSTVGSQQDTYSTYNSSSNVYAGLELRHSSGLHLQCAFNGSIASYSGWNISLGYVY